MSRVTELCGRLLPDLKWDIEPSDDHVRHTTITLLKKMEPTVRLRLRADVLDFPAKWLSRKYGADLMTTIGFKRNELGQWVRPKTLSADAYAPVFMGASTKPGFMGRQYCPNFKPVDIEGESFDVETACGVLHRYHGVIEAVPPKPKKQRKSPKELRK